MLLLLLLLCLTLKSFYTNAPISSFSLAFGVGPLLLLLPLVLGGVVVGVGDDKIYRSPLALVASQLRFRSVIAKENLFINENLIQGKKRKTFGNTVGTTMI